MSNRRNFSKASIAAAASAGAVNFASAFSGALPPGLIYTAENPGKWASKVKSHLPVVTVEGNKITVETKHVMSEEHFIVRHTIVSASDEDAKLLFELPQGKSAQYAPSFCNRHDMWVAAIPT